MKWVYCPRNSLALGRANAKLDAILQWSESKKVAR